jgi:hypothetical protein
MILGLRLLGVHDWRCIAVALISWPSVFAFGLGAIGPLLLLGAGVAWRWRNALWPPAVAVAAMIVANLFPWPLAGWLLVTRRFRTLALTVLIGVVVTLAAWAVIGFGGMSSYPQMVSNATFIQEGRAASLVAVLLALGVGVTVARVAAIIAGLALLGTAWRFARRPEGERQAFALAIMAVLIASPIVWQHHMVLLFVPIALLSPRLSPLWFVAIGTSVIQGGIRALLFLESGRLELSDTSVLRVAIVWLVVEAAIVALVCWPRALGLLHYGGDADRSQARSTLSDGTSVGIPHSL